MSDKMTPVPFGRLMEWILEEKKSYGTVFGIHRPYRAVPGKTLSLFGGRLETPVGPAAGPHTQLAQNLAAAYYAGGRFFELKTVQTLDGEALPVEKPCIRAEDECYNVEWSTELTVPQAFEEYVKAWFAIRVMAREFELGEADGFLFNMSVGYDLEGIRSKKLDAFMDGLSDAAGTPIYRECKGWLLREADRFSRITREELERFPSRICNSVTLSTLHGCPSREIERIAEYLLEEKGFHTFIKCNPTLLGCEFARKTLDEMGYDYVSFDDFHFKEDLQYEDAVPMFRRLMKLAEEKGLSFGVKITNTFPVEITAGELPGKEMYMSGRPLYPLSIALAAKLAGEFDGGLRISYSGGADFYNIDRIYKAGIWPVTLAATLLKPGGYQRMEQIAKKLSGLEYGPFTGVDTLAARRLSEEARTDIHHLKAKKPLPSRKLAKRVPLLDCFLAPCKEGCPIHQDITAYMKLAGEGRSREALSVITEKNPLPFTTGTICPHPCMEKCTRNFYEEPVQIRDMKLSAARDGYDAYMRELEKPPVTKEGKASVVGGGPAGLAAAFFLARGGMRVTLFEKTGALGGVAGHVIPEFRLPAEALEKDIRLVRAMGVEIVLNREIISLKALKSEGYAFVVLAIGAGRPGSLRLEEGKSLNAIAFLKEYKEKNGLLSIGKQVVVIGGGNTAMDAARAAGRIKGVERVFLVYRRTRRYMPADEEELLLALSEGVEFRELLSPIRQTEGAVICRKMTLGKRDASGRRAPVETEELVRIPADTVIAATGERIDSIAYRELGIDLDEKGRPVVEEETLESGLEGVYIAGDGRNGPATVVEAIRDARLAAEAILKRSVGNDREAEEDEEAIYRKKGVLAEPEEGKEDACRCLTCSAVCESCVEVCPNRANVAVSVPGMKKRQILHIDAMCNECGNCRSFCPYDSAPYLDKFTLFSNETDFEASENQGFLVLDAGAGRFRVRTDGKVREITADRPQELVDERLVRLMRTVCRNYGWLPVMIDRPGISQ